MRKVLPSTITKISVLLGALAFVSLIVYLWLYTICVITHEQHGTVYFPLWVDGDLAKLVSVTGGRWQALDQAGYTSVSGAVKRMPPYALPITTGVLLFFYQMMFTAISAAFGIVGFHKNVKLDLEDGHPGDVVNDAVAAV